MKWVSKTPESGDMVRVKLGTIYHFGIFVSETEIIQFGLAPGVRGLLPDCEVEVLASDLRTFLAGGILEVCVFEPQERQKHRTPQAVIAWARQRIGERGYHILYNNCEHFANECLSGEHICHQADDVRAMFRNLPVVDVYVAEMPGDAKMPPLSCTLRQEDVERVSSPELRRQKYFVWKLLEYALERSFGFKNRDLTFRKEGDRFVCDRAYFSLSHDGDALAVAVSRAPVGVDVQRIAHRHTDSLAERTLNGEELAFYTQLSEDEKTHFFYRTWSSKEALFKAAQKDVFIPKEQNTFRENVKNYETSIGGQTFYLSVATQTPDRIRFYENIRL